MNDPRSLETHCLRARSYAYLALPRDWKAWTQCQGLTGRVRLASEQAGTQTCMHPVHKLLSESGHASLLWQCVIHSYATGSISVRTRAFIHAAYHVRVGVSISLPVWSSATPHTTLQITVPSFNSSLIQYVRVAPGIYTARQEWVAIPWSIRVYALLYW
jgi:hypothetical protein